MTVSCESVRSWLPAWIDGERTPLSPEDFERHLAECADCVRAARDQRGFLRTVSSAYVPAPVPPSLQASIHRKVSWRRVFSQRVAPLVAAGAMAAAIALVVITALRPTPVQAASLAEASAWAHEGLASGALPLDVAASNAAELSQWLTERVGFTVVLPKLEDSTLVFNGARVVQLEEGSAAVVSFQRSGECVSLGIAPRHAAGSPANAPRTELFRNMKFTTSTLRGLHVITWSEGALSYALVSSVPSTGRASCAVCHGANSGLKSVEDFHGMR
ncbi:putative transmembrane anti-sigma factor [Hyalangium minutum]|uniref:Putative transmembrane anti-sigma factor n=1 Tax=Hyalangium minutum TaxID=394096 RepID=A0A085WSN4_9BACT|nr:putative transmembrane anti-sigma factor [Hyalangium minutum]